MTLAFPNRSRNYDDARRQVRFYGYEGMHTVPFRVDVDAIIDQVPPDTNEEAAYLAALPKAPNNYHPFRQTKAALARRNWIIGQMQRRMQGAKG